MTSPAAISIVGSFALQPAPLLTGASAAATASSNANQTSTWPLATITHSFTFDAQHPPPAQPTAAPSSSAPASSAGTGAAAISSSDTHSTTTSTAAPAAEKVVRVSANTLASHPSQLARTCPTDESLSQLAAWMRAAQVESDRFLTGVMKQREVALEALNPGGAVLATGKRKQRRDEDGDGDEDGEENEDDEAEEDGKKRRK